MRQNKEHCPTCGQNVSERQVALVSTMVEALWSVFKWCAERRVHEFRMSDVRHLFGQVAYTRMSDWRLFGGLVYKKGRGRYGLNLDRCEEFLAGRLEIPTSVWLNPVTRQTRAGAYRNIRGIPNVANFLDGDRQYVAMYRNPQPRLESVSHIVKVPSGSVKGLFYTITISGEKAECDCPSFRFRQTCKHVDEARKNKESLPQRSLFELRSP